MASSPKSSTISKSTARRARNSFSRAWMMGAWFRLFSSRSVETAGTSLIATHARRDNRKRDFLTAAGHVERWAVRNAERASHIAQAAADFTWERDAARSRSVAVATYSRPDEGAKVWIEGLNLVGLEKTRVERALAGWA